ncbi:MAG: cysteine--tRNA ligase [Synergistaceae bacterium]|nr:cysteine--tRNA ligase [Synergistaceae bacterium]
MSLQLYNDMSAGKESFEPLEPGAVSFYVCGPTVYDYFHIGNARPFIVFDVLRRYLEFNGLKVNFVQNFTDVDDKMIQRAHQLGITVPELAERFIEAYYEDADALGIRRATHNPRATQEIPAIIAIIEKLIDRGHAYEAGGDIYFEVSTFQNYGKLSKQNLEDLDSGARVEVDERKRHPLDFALWKAQKPGEPAWESPWSMGRPGWHIECSAMATRYLGETIDIHGGGSDLIFPHHENEVAQSECAHGRTFARFWIHNGYVMLDREKMSKSLGNFFTVREVRAKYSTPVIRLFMLSAHYRSPINFSEETLEQAKSAYERLRNGWAEISYALEARPCDVVPCERDDGLREAIKDAMELFVESMDDDFNTAGAIGAIFDIIRATNSSLGRQGGIDYETVEEAANFLRSVDDIMGILQIDSMERSRESETDEIDTLIKERNEARARKDFARSDEIRKSLSDRGIILEDTPQGTRWKKAEA